MSEPCPKCQSIQCGGSPDMKGICDLDPAKYSRERRQQENSEYYAAGVRDGEKVAHERMATELKSLIALVDELRRRLQLVESYVRYHQK